MNATTVTRRRGVRCGRDWRDDRGSMMVELAGFLLPAIVLVMAIAVAALNLSVSRIDLEFTAAAAARTASLQRTPAAAADAATQTAQADLAARSITCADLRVSTDVSQWRRGGSVTVTVSCTVRVGALAGFAGIPATLTAHSTATAAIDVYRQVTG
jgi:Flp pilus assembly protein TadG